MSFEDHTGSQANMNESPQSQTQNSVSPESQKTLVTSVHSTHKSEMVRHINGNGITIPISSNNSNDVFVLNKEVIEAIASILTDIALGLIKSPPDNFVLKNRETLKMLLVDEPLDRSALFKRIGPDVPFPEYEDGFQPCNFTDIKMDRFVLPDYAIDTAERYECFRTQILNETRNTLENVVPIYDDIKGDVLFHAFSENISVYSSRTSFVNLIKSSLISSLPHEYPKSIMALLDSDNPTSRRLAKAIEAFCSNRFNNPRTVFFMHFYKSISSKLETEARNNIFFKDIGKKYDLFYVLSYIKLRCQLASDIFPHSYTGYPELLNLPDRLSNTQYGTFKKNVYFTCFTTLVQALRAQPFHLECCSHSSSTSCSACNYERLRLLHYAVSYVDPLKHLKDVGILILTRFLELRDKNEVFSEQKFDTIIQELYWKVLKEDINHPLIPPKPTLLLIQPSYSTDIPTFNESLPNSTLIDIYTKVKSRLLVNNQVLRSGSWISSDISPECKICHHKDCRIECDCINNCPSCANANKIIATSIIGSQDMPFEITSDDGIEDEESEEVDKTIFYSLNDDDSISKNGDTNPSNNTTLSNNSLLTSIVPASKTKSRDEKPSNNSTFSNNSSLPSIALTPKTKTGNDIAHIDTVPALPLTADNSCAITPVTLSFKNQQLPLTKITIKNEHSHKTGIIPVETTDTAFGNVNCLKSPKDEAQVKVEKTRLVAFIKRVIIAYNKVSISKKTSYEYKYISPSTEAKIISLVSALIDKNDSHMSLSKTGPETGKSHKSAQELASTREKKNNELFLNNSNRPITNGEYNKIPCRPEDKKYFRAYFRESPILNYKIVTSKEFRFIESKEHLSQWMMTISHTISERFAKYIIRTDSVHGEYPENGPGITGIFDRWVKTTVLKEKQKHMSTSYSFNKPQGSESDIRSIRDKVLRLDDLVKEWYSLDQIDEEARINMALNTVIKFYSSYRYDITMEDLEILKTLDPELHKDLTAEPLTSSESQPQHPSQRGTVKSEFEDVSGLPNVGYNNGENEDEEDDEVCFEIKSATHIDGIPVQPRSMRPLGSRISQPFRSVSVQSSVRPISDSDSTKLGNAPPKLEEYRKNGKQEYTTTETTMKEYIKQIYKRPVIIGSYSGKSLDSGFDMCFQYFELTRQSHILPFKRLYMQLQAELLELLKCKCCSRIELRNYVESVCKSYAVDLFSLPINQTLKDATLTIAKIMELFKASVYHKQLASKFNEASQFAVQLNKESMIIFSKLRDDMSITSNTAFITHYHTIPQEFIRDLILEVYDGIVSKAESLEPFNILDQFFLKLHLLGEVILLSNNIIMRQSSATTLRECFVDISKISFKDGLTREVVAEFEVMVRRSLVSDLDRKSIKSRFDEFMSVRRANNFVTPLTAAPIASTPSDTSSQDRRTFEQRVQSFPNASPSPPVHRDKDEPGPRLFKRNYENEDENEWPNTQHSSSSYSAKDHQCPNCKHSPNHHPSSCRSRCSLCRENHITGGPGPRKKRKKLFCKNCNHPNDHNWFKCYIQCVRCRENEDSDHHYSR